ncbi:recombinase family protein [Terrabacter sp. 2TAF16]|uniref:recombinase family protein n=1 Tax=Terrabacter sp. 2TAF16 TaxID=3233008 RepID=UPI003F9C3907
MSKRAAIYARQSLDRSGDGMAVSRQLAECRELCERNGWVVEEIYQDNDRSATSGKPRPEWRRLLEDLIDGRYDVLVCWHTDRLYRRLRDLVDLVEIAERRALTIATVKASDLDLSTPSGRMVASLLGSVAAYEGQQKAARQIAANRQRAQAGTVLWTRRPFGFQRDGDHVSLVDGEAAEIRKAAERVIAGDTLASIASDWNTRGIPTTIGNRWSVTSVRRVLLNPRTAGRVSSKGEDFGSAQLTILSTDVAARVGAILRDPARKASPPSTAVKYLLSGIALCGRDDAVMYATTNAQGRLVYRCRTCYSTRHMTYVDEVVVGVLRERLSRSDASDLLQSGDQLERIRTQVSDLRRRRDGLAELLADGLLDADAVRAQAGPLTAQIDRLELEQGGGVVAAPLARVVQSTDVVKAIDHLELKELRTVIKSLMTVHILPSGRGVRFSPEQVRIDWAGR